MAYFGGGTVAGVDSELPGEELVFSTVSPDADVSSPAVLATQATFSTAFSSLVPPVSITRAAGEFALVYSQGHGGIVAPWRVPRGTFLSSDGQGVSREALAPLMQAGGPVGDVFRTGWSPSVAFDGHETLVVWLEARASLATQEVERDVRAAWTPTPGERTTHVRLSGLAAPAVRAALAGFAPAMETAVAGNDGQFLVLWSAASEDDPTTATEIRGLHYSPTEGVLSPDRGFVVAEGPVEKTLGGVAFRDGRYLAIWGEQGGVYGARIAPGGEGDVPFALEAGPTGAHTTVTSSADRFLILFTRPEAGDTASLWGVFAE